MTVIQAEGVSIQTTTLSALDGYSLIGTLFEPQHHNQRVVMINAAMGAKQTYYADYASYLAEQGFVVFTYDYRGIGQSKPENVRTIPANLLNWATDDQTGAIIWLKTRYPSAKLLIVGHSLGGQIAGLTPENSHIAGLLGIAAQSGYWRKWGGRLAIRMGLLWYVIIPLLTRIYGYFPARLVGMGNQDLPAKAIQEWAQSGRMPLYLRDHYRGSNSDYFDTFTAPMLLYSFEDDDFAPRSAVAALPELYPNATATLKHITPSDIGEKAIGHFGFFRSKYKEMLWAGTVEWLKKCDPGV